MRPQSPRPTIRSRPTSPPVVVNLEETPPRERPPQIAVATVSPVKAKKEEEQTVLSSEIPTILSPLPSTPPTPITKERKVVPEMERKRELLEPEITGRQEKEEAEKRAAEEKEEASQELRREVQQLREQMARLQKLHDKGRVTRKDKKAAKRTLRQVRNLPLAEEEELYPEERAALEGPPPGGPLLSAPRDPQWPLPARAGAGRSRAEPPGLQQKKAGAAKAAGSPPPLPPPGFDRIAAGAEEVSDLELEAEQLLSPGAPSCGSWKVVRSGRKKWDRDDLSGSGEMTPEEGAPEWRNERTYGEEAQLRTAVASILPQ